MEGFSDHPIAWVHEYTHASNERHAKKLVALRLEERWGWKPYLGDCVTTQVPENPGKKK